MASRILRFQRPAERHGSVWLRESARALLALGLFFSLGAWDWGADLGHRYWSVIAVLTRPLLGASQHFKELPATAAEIPSNQHTHLVLLLVLFLVSWRVPLRRRLEYFAILAGVAFLQDVAAASLSLRLHEAKTLFAQRGWVMLLPWEYNAFQFVWYLLYALPLQAAPFLLLLITALWNAHISPSDLLRQPPSVTQGKSPSAEAAVTSRFHGRVWVWVAIPSLLLVMTATTGVRVWTRIRERDPLHQRTHVLLGNARLQERRFAEAEAEYRQAIDWGSDDGEPWVRLAQARAILGDRDEAIGILKEAARVVQDPSWRDRIAADLEALGSSDPYRIPPIVAVESPQQP